MSLWQAHEISNANVINGLDPKNLHIPLYIQGLEIISYCNGERGHFVLILDLNLTDFQRVTSQIGTTILIQP